MTYGQWTRRRFIEAGCAATLYPWHGVFAQGAGSLVRAPRQALVIGNGRYKQSPLKNPSNDAKGMAEALRSTGFDVTLGLEMSQAEMSAALSAYLANLIKAKAVGLFYFAGHGVQLAWRNYLLPIDAEIGSIDELRERAIDVNSVIDGIRKAGNPMNIIILDACRDNPFGALARVGQRGLSQLDAPRGTLLAYATAPGNTAADGDGDNGLYTENLLREIKVPETKVEDVFKRVRLSVRRSSNGQQLPWESTSLEEDFWFIPPAQVKKLAEAEAEREFNEELALWKKIQSTTEPRPLEDYLRRYPSGRFSELAQLRLDQVLAKAGENKVEVVSAPQNPYSQGAARMDTAYRIGDTYTYRRFDVFTKVETQSETFTVSDITETQIVYSNGTVSDLLGNELKGSRQTWGPNQTVPTEFAIGKRWRTRFDAINPWGEPNTVDLQLRIVAREQVTVPAGTFSAFRVEGDGWGRGPQVNALWELKQWFAPDQVRRWIVRQLVVRAQGGAGKVTASLRSELAAFKQS